MPRLSEIRATEDSESTLVIQDAKGLEFTVRYSPDNISVDMIERFGIDKDKVRNDLGLDDLVDATLTFLVWWDLLDDYDKPLKITKEVLRKMGIGVLLLIFRKIMEAQKVPEPSGTTSASPFVAS